MLAGVHGYASGAGYDDGVYLTVALRLVNGVLPYRDFVFVHPPGSALMLSPLAALSHVVGTRDVLVLARIATVLVVATNSALASLIVRHRGMAASVTAGVLLAGFPGASTRTTQCYWSRGWCCRVAWRSRVVSSRRVRGA